MKLPIMTCVLIFSLVIAYFNHKDRTRTEAEENEFWEKERAANSTRRKPLDDMNYITIPLDSLPTNIHLDNDIIHQCIDTIVELSKSPIVNLTGISNTDLKLQYGAPNIDVLTAYDQRYTTLARTLQKWGQTLYDIGDIDNAQIVLEYAVSTCTDVSGTYKLLSTIYSQKGDMASIEKLIPIARSLNTPLKDAIVDSLNKQLL